MPCTPVSQATLTTFELDLGNEKSFDLHMFTGNITNSTVLVNRYLQNPDGATNNLARKDMRQFEFLTLSRMSLNSLPNDKTLDQSKLKAFPDNNINVT